MPGRGRPTVRAALPALAALLLASLVAGEASAGARWDDVTSPAGIAFQTAGELHPPGEELWPAFPEVIGGGVCWFDADGDGYDDLYFPNQQFNRDNPAAGGWVEQLDPHGQLYLNLGDGTFRDVSAEAGVDTRAFAYGCSAADYDGDGCVDLFVSALGASELFRNRCDGTFDNVTATASPGGPLGDASYCDPGHPCQATSSAWADYDRDGDLDLYVGTYINNNLTDPVRSPRAHTAQLNWLLRNNGDGTFEDVAKLAGVAGNPTDRDGTKTLGVVWLDHDLDGWLDLYVANDEEANHLFHNLRDGTFADVAPQAGVADVRASMGVAARDYDNDGWPDLFMTHYEGEENGFYRNNQNGTFEDRSGEDDLTDSLQNTGWGVEFVDFDRDGDLDIVLVNGSTEWVVPWYDQQMQVFRNDPEPGATAPWDKHWTNVSWESGPVIAEERVHRGAAFADMDLDGDVDIATSQNGNESAQLLQGSGVEHRWLNLKLGQPGPNRFGVGARIVLEAAGQEQVREVQAGSTYLGQNTLVQMFGLGASPRADKVTVAWPDGATTAFGPLAANQTLRLARDGSVANDTLSPLTTASFTGLRGNAGWWRSAVQATLEARDRGSGWASGLASTEFALEDGAWEPYDGRSFSFSGDGPHVLRMRSTDHAGNQEPVRTERVRIDTTPPVATHRLDGLGREDGWFSGPVVVRINATDATSGVASLRYRLDRGPWLTYRFPVRVAGEGIHDLAYRVEDKAGNVDTTWGVQIRIDTTAPRVALTKPGPGSVLVRDFEAAQAGVGPAVAVEPPAAGVSMVAEASDELSGVAQVEFWVDGARAAVVTSAPYTWTWDARAAGEGLHDLAAVARDLAGNEAVHALRVLVVSPDLPKEPLGLGWATDARRWRP